ncbi:MAG: hypothetical protein Q8P62_04255 [Candidatus Peregrinibacteria bacterium]|nr:hypothetical protein [Candidatus Peregrinibacteria bacterium]
MKKILLSGLGVLLAVLTVSSSAFALTVSPTKIELKGDPGQVVSGDFELLNEQKNPITLYPSYENFEASGEDGTPNFVAGDYDLAVWMKAQDSVTLKAGEYQKIPFTITIPKDADAGGHYAAVFWGTNPPAASGETSVSIGAKTGILILLTVSGDVKEGGSLLEFSAKENQRFFTSLPIDFYYRFQNGGGDRLKPTGTVKIKNTFWLTADEFDANKTNGNVLPNSTRRFVTTWDGIDKDDLKEDVVLKDENLGGKKGFFDTVSYQWNHFAMGMYTAKLGLTYGSDAKIAGDSFIFFVLPWQLMIVMALIILVVFFVLRFGIRKYNKWVINNALASRRRK